MVTREEAASIAGSEIAKRGLVASVKRVVAMEDCKREPVAYGVCFQGCWIVYLDLPGSAWSLEASTILAIDRLTGDLRYCGSAQGEG